MKTHIILMLIWMLNLIDEEILKIAEFKKQILENPKNYELFDDIFFSEILKWGFMKILKILMLLAVKVKN